MAIDNATSTDLITKAHASNYRSETLTERLIQVQCMLAGLLELGGLGEPEREEFRVNHFTVMGLLQGMDTLLGEALDLNAQLVRERNPAASA